MSNDGVRVRYEQGFASLVGARHARAVCRGREALALLLQSLGVGVGDHVGVCAFTCLSVVEAVRVLGAIPVYLDVDETLCIDPAEISSGSHGSLKVIILQHTFGVPGQLDALCRACRAMGARLVEDCAHALGSLWNGRPLGQFGDGGIYSFQWGKPYTTGQGGMVTVNSQVAADSLDRCIVDAVEMLWRSDVFLSLERRLFVLFHGTSLEWVLKDIYYALRERGFVRGGFTVPEEFRLMPGYFQLAGPRMSEAGMRQVEQWNELQQIRRNNVREIESAFDQAGLPRWPVPPEAQVTMLRYPVLISHKDAALEAARRCHVDIAGWYATPVHPIAWEDLNRVDYRPGQCPKAETMIRKLVHIPTDAALDSKRLMAMVNIIAQYKS